jgi:hypothetical protein
MSNTELETSDPTDLDFYLQIDYDVDTGRKEWVYRGCRVVRAGRVVALHNSGDVAFDWTLLKVLIRNIRGAYSDHSFTFHQSVRKFLREVPGFEIIEDRIHHLDDIGYIIEDKRKDEYTRLDTPVM